MTTSHCGVPGGLRWGAPLSDEFAVPHAGTREILGPAGPFLLV